MRSGMISTGVKALVRTKLGSVRPGVMDEALKGRRPLLGLTSVPILGAH